MDTESQSSKKSPPIETAVGVVRVPPAVSGWAKVLSALLPQVYKKLLNIPADFPFLAETSDHAAEPPKALMNTGVLEGVVFPVPSCPYWLSPQAYKLLPFMANVCLPSLETFRHPVEVPI